MASTTWTALYRNARLCDPSELLKASKVAQKAIYERLNALGLPDTVGGVRELRALYDALSDLNHLVLVFLRRS
jgi:hypothetical protein